jgi:hypothetical protein
MFRPHKYVMRKMFQPHGIELACTPILEEGTITAVPAMAWKMSNDQRTRISILEPLSWMQCFPSANKMCGSVHELSMKGEIGLMLPQGEVRMVARSYKSGGTNLVVDLTLIEIETTESPYAFASNQSRLVRFHQGRAAVSNRSNRKCRRDESIPRRSDGTIDLTDEEWALIEPIMVSKQYTPNRIHDPRLKLNGILRKLGDGIPWKKTEYQVGTWTDAHIQYMNLKRTDKWPTILSILEDSRTNAWEPYETLRAA